MSRYLILSWCIFLFVSCGKEKEEIVFTQITTNTTQDISSISALNDQLIAVGGEVFQNGIVLTGEKMNWSAMDTFSDKQLFGLDCNDEQCIAVGQDGYYYTYNEENGWNYIRLSEWDFQRAVSISSRHTVTTSGKSFEEGRIYHLNYMNVVDTVISYEAQIQDVASVTDDIFIAVGYGTILRSIDGGYNWEHIDKEGDFYYSVDFADSKNGIIVGLSGSIFVTADGGSSWDTVKRPSSISSNRAHFLSVKYINPMTIFIVGDEGLLWQSNDGGQSWDEYQINTEHNLNDLAELDGVLYVVGDNGYMGMLNL